MTKEKLSIILKQEGYPSDIFNFEEAFPNEAFTIFFNGQQWETYYSERGQKSGLKIFDTEKEACEHLYQTLTS